LQMWPSLQRQRGEVAGVRQMMLKGTAGPFAMHMPHEIALAIAAYTRAQNMIVHATADIDGIDLHKTQMIERRARISKSGIQTSGLPHETARGVEAERK